MPRLLALLVFALALISHAVARAQEKADPVVTEAIHDLTDKNPQVRRDAAILLGNRASGSADPDEQRAIPALVTALKDPKDDVRGTAAFALGNIASDGKIVVPALVETLNDENDLVREHAARSLGSIQKEAHLAVPALAVALTDKSNSVRDAALTALIRFGREAKDSFQTLVNLLKSDNATDRFRAAQALAAIGPDAREAAPLLTAELKDQDAGARLEAAGALAKIGVNQPDAVPIAIRLLNNEDFVVRFRAAAILGDFGASGQSAVPALTKALDDEDSDVRRIAASSLDNIATALQQSHSAQAAGSLKDATAAMEQSTDPRVKAHADDVSDAAIALEIIHQHSFRERVLRPIRQWPLAAALVSVYVAITMICLGLFWLSPISVLRINEALRPFPKIRMPGWLGGIEISVPYLILIGFLHYRHRVLNAWVARRIHQARASFEMLDTVKSHTDKPGTPVTVDGHFLPALTANDLRAAFARTSTCIVIWGDDKEKRTSLACQIGRWAMDADASRRPNANLMLPVLLEENFTYEPGSHVDPFTSTIRDELRLDQTAPSIELVVRLLESKFVLVIIDGLSELNEQTKSMIRPDNSDFPARALVVTSRVEEKFGQLTQTTIKPSAAAAPLQ
jgi:HEAT repeat protein